MSKKTKKVKKISIREFVNEEDIKFELYHMKYSNQLLALDKMTEEEIQDKWLYDNTKKANRYRNDLTKPENQNSIAQKALKQNIDYVLNLPAPINKDIIIANFNEKLEKYLKTLNKRLQDNIDDPVNYPLAPYIINSIKETIIYVNDIKTKGLTKNPNKERFGTLLLLMIKNLATMPSFSGYSENWTQDFFSNAVEKTILYLDNFDESLLSKRSGDKSKAFAYVTQICFNAFVNIINIRKKESKFLKDTISYETHNFEGVMDMTTKTRDDQDENNILNKANIHKIIVKKNTPLKVVEQMIKEADAFMIDHNEIISLNSAIIKEINELQKPGVVPEEEKTKDYFDYLDELKSKVIPQLDNNIKNVLIVQKPEDMNIEGLNYNIKFNVIITSNKDIYKKKENSKSKNKNSFNGYDTESGLTLKQQQQLKEQEDYEKDLEAYDNEW